MTDERSNAHLRASGPPALAGKAGARLEAATVEAALALGREAHPTLAVDPDKFRAWLERCPAAGTDLVAATIF